MDRPVAGHCVIPPTTRRTNPKEFPMSSQHIVIAGGSSGIGLATARLLLAQGHKVTITGRNSARLETASKTLSGDLVATVMDAADAERLPEAFSGIGAFDH